MTPQFQIPTDNLYKFVCLLFFCIFVASFIVPPYMNTKIEMELIEVEAKFKGLTAKIENSHSQVQVMNSILDSKVDFLARRMKYLNDGFDYELEVLESKNSVSRTELKEVKSKSVEIMTKKDNHLNELVKHMGSSNEITDRMYKTYDLLTDLDINRQKQALLSTKLEQLNSHAFNIRLGSGIISLVFFILWWRWQVKMDEHLLQK